MVVLLLRRHLQAEQRRLWHGCYSAASTSPLLDSFAAAALAFRHLRTYERNEMPGVPRFNGTGVLCSVRACVVVHGRRRPNAQHAHEAGSAGGCEALTFAVARARSRTSRPRLGGGGEGER